MGIVVFLIVIVVLAAAAAAGVAMYRTRSMRSSFGPEYERMVREQGSPGAADSEARRRLRAHASLELRTLSEEEKSYYTKSWGHVKGDFVDHPAASVAGADRLVRTLLDDLGYRGDAEEQLALLSVQHGPALAGYRDALEVVREVEDGSQEVPTERMRVAVAACGRLFDELIGGERAPGQQTAAPEARAA